jgi:two-component system, chemotaxis family, protein-glutamate methylesterase/glutaminase
MSGPGVTRLARTEPTRAGTPARVMICDDSATIRGAMARMLEADPAIHVVAKVANGRMAIEELKRTKVDVLLLDIEMPVMDGMTALPLLLEADPGLRIIMSSTLTTRGADVAMRALRMGAADYVPKPSSIGATSDERFRLEIISKVKGLARLRNAGAGPARTAAAIATRPAPVRPPKMLAIGSSTGGPQALFTLIQALGRSVNIPVILTQHMPATFTPILAEHITKLGGLPCAEAKDGEHLLPGHIYLAPGDKHLIIEPGGEAGGHGPLQKGAPGGIMARARLSTDPPENFCRPSVDPMLRSAAAVCDGRVLVAMLTGMGHDGLDGTRRVVEAGGAAIAQDEATSVVWGMPGAIAQAGLCHAVLPLPRIAPKLLEMLRVSAR